MMTRKDFLKSGIGLMALSQWPILALAEKAIKAPALLKKPIPSTGQKIASVGMGTWITFNVGASKKVRDARTEVLKTFFDLGGELVDSSPMYGSAEEVVGYAYENLKKPNNMFAATKVWTGSTSEGRQQHKDSLRLWKRSKLELQQIHNLLNWEEHLKTLRALQEKGEVRYIGITTSHGRRHSDLEEIMKKHKLDFVQLTYNITHRSVEDRLLEVAKDKGIAVIANRPYDGGQLMQDFKSKPLPGVAKEAGINSWAELFLKWITSHESVTVAIPATSKVAHMQENMQALKGNFFDAKLRKELVKALS